MTLQKNVILSKSGERNYTSRFGSADFHGTIAEGEKDMAFNNFGGIHSQDTDFLAKTRTVLSGNDFSTFPPEKLMKGKYLIQGKDDSYFYVTDQIFSTGLLLIGNTECGKTTTLINILDQIMPAFTNNDVMIIFDSKGDFKRKYYNPQNPNHILVSLRKEDEKYARTWNVFRELTDEEGYLSADAIDINTAEISKALHKGMESSMQPFFTVASSDFLGKIASSLVREAMETRNASKLNNYSFSNLLSSSTNTQMLELTGRYPEYRYLRSYVGDGSSNQSLGVYGHMMAVKERTFIGSFNKNDPGRDFGIREVVRNRSGKILFLEYDVRYAETLSVVYSLLMDLAIKEAVSSPGGNKWFICDEASLLPYLEHIGSLLNFGRSYGCKTIFALQSYAQLEDNYDEKKASVIAAGFCNMFAYQNTDFATRKYIKERCGEVFEVYNYGGQNISCNSFTVRDSDLKNLQAGEAFIDIKNFHPFKFRFKE